MFRREQFRKNVIVREPRKERADVLLVYPIWVEVGGKVWPPRNGLQRMLPPLGILSIASVLERAGLEVHVVDVHAEQIFPDEFREIVRRLRPRFVGITVLSAHLIPANHIARICKEEVPDAQVFAGGVHAESCPEQMLRNPSIDAVGRGDGEQVMLDLVRGVPYASVPGLSYRTGGRVVHNALGPAAALDDFPFPAYHLIDFSRYYTPPASYRDLPAMNVLMTRGCPGKCTFCNSANTVLRSRSPEKMVELITLLRYTYGIRQLYFYDDTFTATPKTVRAFCDLMIRERIDVKWICYVRGDMFTDDLATLMAQAGCHQVLMGIESGSAELMRAAGKPIRKARYLDAVRIAHRHGIEVRGSFIMGHREETRATLQETLAFAQEIELDLFQLNIMTPYPGTQLYQEARDNGWLFHEEYSRYGQNEVVLKMAHLTPEEIPAFAKHAYLAFYLRPRAIWTQLKRLTNLSQAKDLLTTFYTLFIEGAANTGPAKQSALAFAWLTFDLDAVADPTIDAPPQARLTYEVRAS